MSYKIIDGETVLNQTTGAAFPIAPGNRDYQEYLAWLEAGHTPEPADAPTLGQVKTAALSSLNTWRGQQRAALGLTEGIYFESNRWQADKSSPLALDSGRLDKETYVKKIISQWDKIEADYNLAVSLIKQAREIDTIAIILARRI